MSNNEEIDSAVEGDDVEGHKQSHKGLIDDQDDVEGHKQSHKGLIDDQDDVEGHKVSHKDS